MILENYSLSSLYDDLVGVGKVISKNQTKDLLSDLGRKDVECTAVSIFKLDGSILSEVDCRVSMFAFS